MLFSCKSSDSGYVSVCPCIGTSHISTPHSVLYLFSIYRCVTFAYRGNTLGVQPVNNVKAYFQNVVHWIT